MVTERRAKLIIRTSNGALDLLTGDIHGALTKRLEREDVYASCFTCLNMYHGAEDDRQPQKLFCKKFQLYPPLKVLVNSCGLAGYEDNDDIPF